MKLVNLLAGLALLLASPSHGLLRGPAADSLEAALSSVEVRKYSCIAVGCLLSSELTFFVVCFLHRVT